MELKGKLAIVTALTTVLIAGCGGAAEPSPSSEPSAAPSGNAAAGQAPAEKKQIQYWHSMGGKNGEYMDELIQAFNASQDGVEVVGTFQGGYDELVTKLQQAIASNTAPDVAMIERAYVEMFADAEVLEDLTPYFDASPEVSVDDFNPGLMGHSVFHDKLVSLPLNRSTPILHVNKTMLDENGLQVPTTWEELKQVATALVVKENGETKRYGYSMPYDTWYPIAMISQMNGTFFNDEKTSVGFIDNGVGEKVFGFLKEQQRSGALYYPPAQDSGNIVSQMFVEGNIGMFFGSTGSIGGLAQAVDFEYATAFLPKGEVYANPTGGANVSMLAASTNKDAAWEFIKWMEFNEEGALPFILKSGYLPFTTTMVESQAMQDLWAKEPNRKVAYEQLQYAVDTNKDVQWPAIMHEFFSAIEAIMYDNADVAPTLGTFKTEAERLLAE